MKVFEKKSKPNRASGHFYYGDFGETPCAISYVEANKGDELGEERRHFSRNGYKYFAIERGRLTIEVGDAIVTIGPGKVLMVEPGEPHRILGLEEAPCHFWVFGTVKDPTGQDKVEVD